MVYKENTKTNLHFTKKSNKEHPVGKADNVPTASPVEKYSTHHN